MNWKAEERAHLNWLKAKIAGLEIEKANAWGERMGEIEEQLRKLKNELSNRFPMSAERV